MNISDTSWRMKDLFLKIYLLRFWWHHLGEWKHEIWLRDLDEQYCCSGWECGCRGISVREMYCRH